MQWYGTGKVLLDAAGDAESFIKSSSVANLDKKSKNEMMATFRFGSRAAAYFVLHRNFCDELCSVESQPLQKHDWSHSLGRCHGRAVMLIRDSSSHSASPGLQPWSCRCGSDRSGQAASYGEERGWRRRRRQLGGELERQIGREG
jgi:hypothetical protein